MKFLKTEKSTEEIGDVQLEADADTIDENNTENSVDDIEVEEPSVDDKVVFQESELFLLILYNKFSILLEF